MKEYKELIHPTLAELINDGKIDRALELADLAIDTAENDEELNPYGKAEKLHEAWEGLAYVRAMADDIEGAAEAFEMAYRIDSLVKFRVDHYINNIIKSDEPRYDQLIADIVYETYKRNAGDEDEEEKDQELIELVSEYAKTHPKTDFILKYIEVNRKTQILREDDSATFEEALEFMYEELSNALIPDDFIYMLTGKVLYFMDQEEMAWKECFSKVDPEVLGNWIDYFNIALLCRITFGDETLSDDIEIPESKRANSLVNVLYSLLRLGPAKYDESWKPEFIETLSEEERELNRRAVYFTRKIANHILNIYDRFEAGEMNGYATSMYHRSEAVRHLGATYEYEFDFERAIEILEDQMYVFATYPVASLLASVSLDAKNDTAIAALNWIIDSEGENLDFEDLFRCYRLRVWAFSFKNDIKEFIEALTIYINELPGIFRCGHFHAFCEEQVLPPSIRAFGYELRWAANNFAEGVDYLLEQYPDNAKLLAVRCYCQSFNPREITFQWVKDKGEYAFNIIKSCEVVENELEGVTKFERIMALMGIDILNIQSKIEEKTRLENNEEEEVTSKELVAMMDALEAVEGKRLLNSIEEGLAILKDDPKDVVGPTTEYSENDRPVSMLRLKLIDAYVIMGDIFNEKWDYITARHYFNKALELADPVLIPLPENVQDNPYEISCLGICVAPDFQWMNIQMRIAETYEQEFDKTNDPDTARKAIEALKNAESQLPILPRGWFKAAKLYEKINSKLKAIEYFQQFSDWFYEDEEEVDDVAYALLQIVKLSVEIEDRDLAQEKMEAYENLQYSHENEEEIRALFEGKTKKKGFLSGIFGKK